MRKFYFSFTIAIAFLFTMAGQANAQAPTITPETEPNNTTGTAQVLSLSAQNCTIVSGSINPGGDLDVFRINGVAAGSRIWISTDPGGTQNPGATSRDLVMDLLAADGTTVIENDDDDGTGNGGDGTIETGLSSMIGGRILTAGGTYYVSLRAFGATAIIDPYKIFIVVTAPGAGAPEVEANNTVATANTLVTASITTGVRTGAIGAAGDVDVYSVVATAGNILHINADADPERDGTGTDLVVELVAPDGTTVLISFDSSISGSVSNPAAEGGDFIITASGTYYVRVRHFSASGTGTYDLMVCAAQPTAATGNPIPTCTSEVEPNNTAGTAQLLNLTAQNATMVCASINPGGDVDFFQMNAVAAGSKIWITTDPGGTQNPGATSRDLVIDLLAADGTTVIENDDDDGTGNGGDGTVETGLASAIGGRTLVAGGTYYIRVRAFSGTAIVDPYKMFVVVTPSSMGTPEVEANNTSATANAIITSGTTTDIRTGAIGAAGDVDFYSAVLTAGNILVVNADADPERDGTGTDLVVEVIAPDGTTILLSFDSSISGSIANPADEAANYIITTSGTYYIKVRHFSASGTGTYHLMAVAAQTSGVVVPPSSPCAASAPQTFTNNTPVAIPTGPAVISSTINVAGAPAYLYDLNVLTSITHTFNSDLDITITSPSGTVVTLTSDNGGANDNVFNGTTWDDNANPAGQVPYTSNNGLATDHLYADLTTATPLAPEEPLGAFIGENPNGTWTITVSDDLAGDGGSLNSWALVIKGLPSAPTLTSTSVTNNTPVAISGGASAVVTSTINVAGAGTQIQDVNLTTFITHTFSSDLDITITSPSGTVVTLTTDNGSGNDDVYNGTIWDDKANPAGQVPYTTNNGMVTDHAYTNLTLASPLTPEEPLAAFIGENPNGVWTLTISDDATGDGGSLNSWTIDLKTSLCGGGPAPCSGTPTPGTIGGPATACAGTAGTLTLSGQSADPGITLQWKSSTTPGGPYTNVSGATGTSLNFTATGTTLYYIVTVTCTGSGLSANTPEFTVAQGATTHTSYSVTITNACSPGSANISGTAAGGNVSGYGVIGTSGTINLAIPDGNPAGVNSSIFVANGALPTAADLKVRINASHTWVGDLKFTLTSPCGTTFLFDKPGTPPLTFGNSDNLGTTNAASNPPPAVYTFDLAGATVIPETSGGAGFIAAGTYKPSDANGAPHTWAGLTFPCAGTGTWQLNVSDATGGDVGTLVSWQIIGPASYTHTLTGPGTITQNPSTGPGGSTGNFTVTNLPGGTHSFVLTSTDGIGCSVSTIITPVVIKPTPVITFVPAAPVICNGQIQPIVANVVPAAPVVFSPVTGLYTDPLATIPYTGTPTNIVYAKPAVTTLYTGVASLAGCTGSATVNVTVNQLPVITTQPSPTTQTICPGFNVSYSVAATGTGLSYQWRRNGVNLVNNAQVSGATTNALTITNVNAANSGNYDVVVTGTCPPPAISNAVTLNVATAPVISTAPANRTACEGTSASFTVATVGSIPPPTIFQWQISTDGGATWTNLTTNGSYTATYTIPAVTLAMNNSRYRVIVTNTCGQSTTSGAGILTVNPAPVVTAAPLTGKICISDTLVALSGSPVGGSWSGIGVSGFNFVPSATAVGTYTLTYTYTNSFGCTGTANVIAKVEDCQERLRLLRDDALILYPNPNNGRFNIRINSTLYNYIGMKVYNVQGQLVNGTIVNDVLVSPSYGGLVYGRIVPIDLTYLPAGVYMVKFYYDDGIRTSEKTFKVVIGAH